MEMLEPKFSSICNYMYCVVYKLFVLTRNNTYLIFYARTAAVARAPGDILAHLVDARADPGLLSRFISSAQDIQTGAPRRPLRNCVV